MVDWIWDLCHAMPKAELHVHLDGAMSVKTAIDLSERRKSPLEELIGTYKRLDGLSRKNSDIPQEEEAGAHKRPDDLSRESSRLSYKIVYERQVIQGRLSTQEELLARYEVPLRLMQDEYALERVTEELIYSKAADNVKYMEIRWAPGLHLEEGLSVEEVIGAVVRGRRKACEKTGMKVKLIATFMRQEPVKLNLELLDEIHEANCRLDVSGEREIVAVDLAGPEMDFPDPETQRDLLLKARELGYHVTLHCGETADAAPMIKKTVAWLAPDRIAHGAGAAEDKELCGELKAKRVQLDLCPTSNIQAGLFKDHASFPVGAFLKEDVPVSISTDSPAISGVTLSEEYYNLIKYGGLSPQDVWKINTSSLDHIFVSDEVKTALMMEFFDWAGDIAELADVEMLELVKNNNPELFS